MSWEQSQPDASALNLAIPLQDDMDDGSDSASTPSGPSKSGLSTIHESASDRQIKRRSSKACDQCRKSKCKCERSSSNEPCKNCVLLGTPCTFLGPSRKRGPPKGYIDAIEARLHQTEALLGILLASGDERAQSLLDDIAQDTLAKEIINRVDSSPYGVKGRQRNNQQERDPKQSRFDPSSPRSQLGSTHPSNEWQDRVLELVRRGPGFVPTGSVSVKASASPQESHYVPTNRSAYAGSSRLAEGAASSQYAPYSSDDSSATAGDGLSSDRRQRRRLEDGHGGGSLCPRNRDLRGSSIRGRSLSQGRQDHIPYSRTQSHPRDSVASATDFSESSDDEMAGAAGQLSLNEDEEVRYHGKASGLYLLGNRDRHDSRNEGGIWRFPKARIWPLLPSHAESSSVEEDMIKRLPPPAVQEQLLEIYFTYVHPSVPIIHKNQFWDTFKSSGDTRSPESDGSGFSSSPFNRRRHQIAPILLFAMFSIAARYASEPPQLEENKMWDAGDQFLDCANTLLDRAYSSSRSSTCQALLLLGYREIGIGAMAQAWIYIGMAIRMAQDLGLHRSADGWSRPGIGGRLFPEWELNERRRIWYFCVIMDKYVSSYIGRPQCISEWDFDTLLPPEDDSEEMELWKPQGVFLRNPSAAATPGRIISCLNASAAVAGILGKIIIAIYSIRPVLNRYEESIHLESLLDRWYIGLPEHLRYDSASKVVPLPHILVLHMQYWCAVLLLHRTFIRQTNADHGSRHSDKLNHEEARRIADKSVELCSSAANHITSIGAVYAENYAVKLSSPFPCYYLFTAGITHVMNLSLNANDPQARLGLTKCTQLLEAIGAVWPSGARALDLLRGSGLTVTVSDANANATLPSPDSASSSRKRTAQEALAVTAAQQSPAQASFPARVFYDAQGFPVDSRPEPHSAPATTHVSDLLYPYDRWPSDGTNTLAFSGSLSASVLPQMYGSTSPSFSDPRQRMQLGSGQDVPPDFVMRRYPSQYYGDFAYGSMGTVYEGYGHQPLALGRVPHPQPPPHPEPYRDQYNI